MITVTSNYSTIHKKIVLSTFTAQSNSNYGTSIKSYGHSDYLKFKNSHNKMFFLG